MTAAESLREVLKLIEDGVLVRNIECDADAGAFMRQGLQLVNVLAKAQDLAAPEEGVTPEAQRQWDSLPRQNLRNHERQSTDQT